MLEWQIYNFKFYSRLCSHWSQPHISRFNFIWINCLFWIERRKKNEWISAQKRGEKNVVKWSINYGADYANWFLTITQMVFAVRYAEATPALPAKLEFVLFDKNVIDNLMGVDLSFHRLDTLYNVVCGWMKRVCCVCVCTPATGDWSRSSVLMLCYRCWINASYKLQLANG